MLVDSYYKKKYNKRKGFGAIELSQIEIGRLDGQI